AQKSLAALYSVATTQDPFEQFFPGQLGAGRSGSDTTSASLSKSRQEMAVVLANHPRERARLDMVLGNVLRSRGEWREAMVLLQNAVRTIAALPDVPIEERANAFYYLGWMQRDIGDLRDA